MCTMFELTQSIERKQSLKRFVLRLSCKTALTNKRVVVQSGNLMVKHLVDVVGLGSSSLLSVISILDKTLFEDINLPAA